MLPALSVTKSVTVEPAGRSVVPEMVGVVSLTVTCASSVSAGALVSNVPISEVVVVLPASSEALAVTV